jgi:hypothetical protein
VVARTWRYAAGLALLGALAGGLVGCTSGPAGPGSTSGPTGGATSVPATSTATSPSSGTATGSATGTLAYPADVPAEARVNSPAGAMAFARHFFAQANLAYTSPRSGLLPPLSTSNCKTCAAFEATASRYVREGLRYDRNPVQILEVSLDAEPLTGGHMVDLVAHQQPSKVINAAGVVVEDIKDQKVIFVLNVVSVDSAWRIDSVRVMQ